MSAGGFVLQMTLLILAFSSSFSQPTEEWVRRHNGSANSYDIVSKLFIDKNNDVLLFGTSTEAGTYQDFLVIKYGNDGEQLWTSRIDGSANSFDQLNSACIDSIGNSYITGYTTDSNFANNITTVKINSAGVVQWKKVFRKAGYSNGIGQDICLDNSGNVNVAAISKNSASNFDIIIIKYSQSGNELWNQYYDGSGSGDDIAVSIRNDLLDNVLIGGTTKISTSNQDIVIIKYNSSSDFIWESKLNGSAGLDDGFSSMMLDSENNIYMCGYLNNAGTVSDFFCSKLNNDGSQAWSHSFNGAGSSLDHASAITMDINGNVYATGYSRNDSKLGSEDILTVKINKSGQHIWSGIYDGISHGLDQGNSVITDDDGNVYVGGASDRGSFYMMYALIKYDSSGNYQWVKNYFNSNTPEDFIYNTVLDDAKNIYVTGISYDSLSDFDFATIKYAQSTGVYNLSNYNPDSFVLYQNYPNPFNPSTTISFTIAFSQKVSLIIYDVLGNKIETLLNQKLNSGHYEVVWNGLEYSSGIYFCELKSGNVRDIKKMILVR